MREEEKKNIANWNTGQNPSFRGMNKRSEEILFTSTLAPGIIRDLARASVLPTPTSAVVLYTTRDEGEPVINLLVSISSLYLNIKLSLCHHVWTRKRRKGTRKGRRKTSPQGAARQHPGNHQASNPTTCQAWWCQEDLWVDL